MEEEIICNRHRDLADAVMNAVPTRRREGNRRRAQLTEDDGKAMTVTETEHWPIPCLERGQCECCTVT